MGQVDRQKQAILCVDDEVIILLSLVQELKRSFGSRFVYERALNAAKALEVIEILAKEDVKVIFIISDWLMPGMKGDEFLELVHEKYPDIHTIMITGQADQAAIDRVKQNASVLAVFTKPWNNEDLIRIIASYAELS
ncbi:MAG: response regulator [Spirochaetales bacterium]|nr:response regulator [Spirochaetales bacterium]